MSRTLALAVSKALSGVKIAPDPIALTGGLDEVTAPLQRKPGVCRFAQNFWASQYGGYQLISGYEAFDGRPSPSAAVYARLDVTITGSFAAGNTIVGATLGGTAVVIAVVTSTTPNYLAITKISGVFQNGEVLNVGGLPQGTTASTAIVDGAPSSITHAQYKNLAADQYRADIAAVPGSGPVRGVWRYNDVVYAFRNNVAATACDMYKSSANGWVQVSFEYEVTYTAGNGASTIVDGGVLTQGGVTATIRRVLVRTGALSAGNAVGSLVISAPAGGNFAAGAATVGAGTLTLDGIQTAITLSPGGRFVFINANFGPALRMYGCDGVNRAFEFDGSYFVPIRTGMTADTPTHIAEHKYHLFLSFAGSVQHSSPGAPYTFSVILGANEIAMGDTITAFAKLPGYETGAALGIFTRNRLSILYGSNNSTWNLVPYREELGAYPYTVQDVGFTLFLDDRGITELQQAQSFGNFSHAAISDTVKTSVNQWRPVAVSSCISRDHNQYRLFFTNKYALYVTVVGRKVVGIIPMLFNDVVRCVCSLEDSSGNEVIYFGSDGGWVFQLDRGTSLDGDPIEFYFDLAYNFQKSPRTLKRYHDATLEISGEGYAEFNFGYSLGYGSTDIAQPSVQQVVSNFAFARWDSFTWDAFFWDGVTLMPSVLKMEGEAENVSLRIQGTSDYITPFRVSGVVIHHAQRRRLRP